MIDINPLLLCDTYKTVHEKLYDPSIEYFTSYLVPRKTMFKEQNKMVFMGAQAFIQEYLVDYFNKNFFKKDIKELLAEYTKYMNIQLGQDNYRTEHIEKLHKLGYLPLKISALPEGSYVNMKIPVIEVTNTIPGYHWLVQWIECLMQNEMWKISNHATIAAMYYKLFKKYYSKTTDGLDPHMAAADFGMRGMSCMDEAARCSAAWLVFSNKTSTIAALPWLDKFYDADCSYNKIGISAPSLEHSVISSSFAIDGDEITLIKKLLTNSFKNSSFSLVSDTYDYWNIVNAILPKLKKEIMEHNGKMLIRPDSGDQYINVIETVQKLWDTFGGTENSKGYKVLDSHIGVILGDGCTLNCVEKILDKLDSMKFAANNVVFGVGAFCFTAVFDGDKMIVNTRDTFGEAFKVTWMKTKDGKAHFVFKDPKTDTDNLKKSHKGLCLVYQDNNTKNYFVKDEFYNDSEINNAKKELLNTNPNIVFPMHVIFENGKEMGRESFKYLRERAASEVC